MSKRFDADAFISYAHLDNVELDAGRGGWVANLQRALQARLAQLLGKESRIWWDSKLRGNDVFGETLIDQVRSVAALVTVISPRYVNSEWGRKELAEFCKAAEEQGGITVQDKARIFKVLKTPVPLEKHPPEVQALLGYEFFKVDPVSGRVRELDEIFGAEAERDFWLKLDDLAYDMCRLLELLAAPDSTPETRGAVFLAETTSDLKNQRETIKRDLQQHGYTVLPDRPLPLAALDATMAAREDLARSRMSIHLIGRFYGLVPEGGVLSLVEMQNELAIERAAAGSFTRLVWIPPGLNVNDARQQQVLDALRTDSRISDHADLLETPLQDLRTAIRTWLERDDKPPAAAAASGAAHVYLLYDPRDADTTAPWSDFFFQEHEVIHPVFGGDEGELREYHEENLRTCDAAIIFYGAANEVWLRRKLAEIKKSAGYGRTTTMPVVAICMVGPKTPEKERFRTHQALVIPQWDGFAPEPLQPVVSAIKERGRGPR